MQAHLGHSGWRIRQLVSNDFIRCPTCGGQLEPSGVEVHRHICRDCGGHFHAVLQFVPVAPIQRAERALGPGDADSGPTSDGGSEVPS